MTYIQCSRYGIYILRKDGTERDKGLFLNEQAAMNSVREFITSSEDVYVIYGVLIDGTIIPKLAGDGNDFKHFI